MEKSFSVSKPRGMDIFAAADSMGPGSIMKSTVGDVQKISPIKQPKPFKGKVLKAPNRPVVVAKGGEVKAGGPGSGRRKEYDSMLEKKGYKIDKYDAFTKGGDVANGYNKTQGDIDHYVGVNHKTGNFHTSSYDNKTNKFVNKQGTGSVKDLSDHIDSLPKGSIKKTVGGKIDISGPAGKHLD